MSNINNCNVYFKGVKQLNAFMNTNDTTKNPTIFHMNVQRCSNQDKFDQLKSYINSLNTKPEIISFVETWFLPNETGEISVSKNPICMYQIQGYTGRFCSRPSRGVVNGRDVRSGGVAVYVREDSEVDLLKSNNGAVPYIHLRISSPRLKEKLLFTSVYMPKIEDNALLMDILETLLTEAGNKKHIIVGDTNLNMADDGLTQRIYWDLLESFNYNLTNDKVTRPISHSIIDHVVTNFDCFTNATVENELSDHCGILSIMPSTLAANMNADKQPHPTKTIVDYQKVNEQLYTTLQLGYFEKLSSSESTQFFVEQLNNIIMRNSKTVKIRNKQFKEQPWLNDHEIGSLIRHKKTLRTKAKKRPNDKKLSRKIEAITLQIKQLKQSLKTNYFLRKFNCSKSCKVKWQEINKILGRSKATTVVRKLIKQDQNELTSTDQLCSEFNAYFSTIDKKFQQQIPTRA